MNPMGVGTAAAPTHCGRLLELGRRDGSQSKLRPDPIVTGVEMKSGLDLILDKTQPIKY